MHLPNSLAIGVDSAHRNTAGTPGRGDIKSAPLRVKSDIDARTVSPAGLEEQKVATQGEEEVSVLFIEDDAAVAEMYRLKLELDGYTVTIAPDGEQGLKLARETPPDIVFLDIRLPRMDGFSVLEALRADTNLRRIPVIILSNYGEAELVERGLKLGALDYLIKAETTPSSLSRGVGKWIKE
jgi:CheY-like chemotaxis protein